MLDILLLVVSEEDIEYEEVLEDDVEISLDPQSQQELELMKAMGLPVDIGRTSEKSKVEINIKVF